MRAAHSSQSNPLVKLLLQKQLFILLLGMFLLTCISWVLLIIPGKSYTMIWLNDTFALIDAAYRVSKGQIPSIDFTSAYGHFNYVFAALGLKLGLNTAIIFAFSGILTFLFIAVGYSYVAANRFLWWMSIPLLIFLWLLLVVPLGIGNRAPSWGMFYNRYSWAGFLVLCLFYLQPREDARVMFWLEAIIMASLTLFLIYTKVTFGVVALGFLFANTLVSQYNRRISLLALGLTGACMGIYEIFSGATVAYIHDLTNMLQYRKAYRSDLIGTVIRLITHTTTLVSLLLAYLMLLYAGRRHLLDALFLIGCTIVNLILMDQNGDARGMPALVAVLVCFGELARRNRQDSTHTTAQQINPLIATVVISMLTLAMVSETMVRRSLGLAYYSHKIRVMQPLPETPASFLGFTVPRRPDSLVAEFSPKYTTHQASNEKANDHDRIEALSTHEYLLSVIDGYKLITNTRPQLTSIFTLEASHPFIFALELDPNPGGHPFLWHASQEHNVSAPQFIGEIEVVMVPRIAYHPEYTRSMWQLYRPYITSNYNLVGTSSYWEMWARNKISIRPNTG